MKNVERINKKLKQSGFRGLSAAALRKAANRLDSQPRISDHQSNYISQQVSAHRVLSRYTSFEGKDILEVGGAQACHSIYPFLEDGAASAIVTGLNHISTEQTKNDYNLQVMRADALDLSNVFGASRFDVVYGLSIVEHIPSPEVFVDEVYRVLKPGGLAYFEGNPIWSSPKGHHLWVATWGGPYKNKATANYLFSEGSGHAATNPLPDWSHLLMTPEQMEEHLREKSIPSIDIECIIDWVFSSKELNRIGMSKIAEAYTNSKLTVLEANISKVQVPHDIQSELRKKCGDGIDNGISGVVYALAKPL